MMHISTLPWQPVGHWRRQIRDGGIADNFRRHDTRHTLATRVLRATGNLAVAQKQLGHARVTTTMKYAHVLTDDVRAGLEQMESQRTKPDSP